MKNNLFWFAITILFLFGLWMLVETATAQRVSEGTLIVRGCDESLWRHVYHPQRLVVQQTCVSVTGVIVDATHGKRKQGCRVEADGDLHCWLKLDAGQEQYINAMNTKNEGGNLVFEPMCQHRVTQKDAMAACKDWKQPFALPSVGTHVTLKGAHVLDTQHGHMECHPCEVEATK